MAQSLQSHNIKNYYIGKGVVSFQLNGTGTFRDIGNVPVFEFTPTLETLEHFSSRAGVKTKDRTVVISKGGTVKMGMEEWTAHNLAMALLGTVDVNSAGDHEIAIFSQNAVSGALRFVGTNEVGPQWQLDFLKVDFIPSAAINPITDEWGVLEVNGEVSAVDGDFGTATLIQNEDGASST